MSSLSFFIASLIFIINGLNHKLPLNKLLGLVVCVNISGIVGSRLLFVLNNFSQFRDVVGRVHLAQHQTVIHLDLLSAVCLGRPFDGALPHWLHATNSQTPGLPALAGEIA